MIVSRKRSLLRMNFYSDIELRSCIAFIWNIPLPLQVISYYNTCTCIHMYTNYNTHVYQLDHYITNLTSTECQNRKKRFGVFRFKKIGNGNWLLVDFSFFGSGIRLYDIVLPELL